MGGMSGTGWTFGGVGGEAKGGWRRGEHRGVSGLTLGVGLKLRAVWDWAEMGSKVGFDLAGDKGMVGRCGEVAVKGLCRGRAETEISFLGTRQ